MDLFKTSESSLSQTISKKNKLTTKSSKVNKCSDSSESSSVDKTSLDLDNLSASLPNKRVKRLSSDLEDSFDLFVGKSKPKKEPIKAKTNKTSKSNYFEKSLVEPEQCLICFSLFNNIEEHIKFCSLQAGISENSLKVLKDIHSQYFSLRKELGISSKCVQDGCFEDSTFIRGPSTSFKNYFKSAKSEGVYNAPKNPLVKWSGGSKKGKSLLIRRSKSERESIITQKIAIILMENQETENQFITVDATLKSDFLQLIENKGTSLWKKSLCQPEEMCKEELYVPALASYIFPLVENRNKMDVNSSKASVYADSLEFDFSNENECLCEQSVRVIPAEKENQLSKSNEEQNEPTLTYHTVSSLVKCDLSEKAEELSKSDQEQDELTLTHGTVSSLVKCDLPEKAEELSKSDQEQDEPTLTDDTLSSLVKAVLYEKEVQLSKSDKEQDGPNLTVGPLSSVMKCETNINSPERTICVSLTDDWEYILESQALTDVDIHFSDGNYKGHSLVFYARYSMVFNDLINVYKNGANFKVLDWKNFSLRAGKAFLRFLYCGIITHFKDLSISELEEIKDFSVKYKLLQLHEHISDVILGLTNIAVEPYYQVGSPDMFADHFEVNCDNSLHGYSNCSGKRKLSSDSGDSLHKKFKENQIKKDVLLNNNDKGDSESVVSSDVITVSSGVITVSSGGSPVRIVASTADGCTNSNQGIPSPTLSTASTLPPPCSPAPVGKLNDFQFSASFKEDNARKSLQFNSIGKELCKAEQLLDSLIDQQFNDSQRSDFITQDTLYLDNVFDAHYDCNNLKTNEEGNMKIEKTTKQPNLIPPEKSNSSEINITPSNKKLIDPYFDDSFPNSSSFLGSIDSGDKPLINNVTPSASPVCQSTPTTKLNDSPFCGATVYTPSPQIIVSDNVTPLLNYSGMISPDLQGELKKYGLKANMDRRKAKMLLRYIYDQIHPVVSCSSKSTGDTHSKILSEAVQSESYESSPVKSTDKDNTEEDHLIEISSESDSGEEKVYLSDFYEEDVEEDSESQQGMPLNKKDDLMEAVSKFIKKDKVLFESILCYVPIWLNKFYLALKDIGIKCKKNELMDILDEMCITFRTEKKPSARRRGRKRKK